jgi:hypothetical protein
MRNVSYYHSRKAAVGRLAETTKGCFVAAKPKKTIPGYAAALEKRDSQKWVGLAQRRKAAIGYRNPMTAFGRSI